MVDESDRLDITKELKFPNLANTKYNVTSPESRIYNCFAWAAGEGDRWWDPIDPDGYWPENVPREQTIEAAIQAYQTLGYKCCASDRLESGYEKIALYATIEGELQHAARQLPDGNWTSKLGKWEDISHELKGLENPRFYGSVTQILSRKI
ncbi:MAG: hypothetical protein AAGA60_04465 [Cyanobacteria bacterium P01_E01_bin.42]